MAARSTLKTARNMHLLRAAQSAGEAFACPVPDEERSPFRWVDRAASLGWVSAGVIAAAGLYLAF